MNNVKALKPRQINAIQLLAMGTPVCRIAETLDVSEMTLYRWQRLPAFSSKLNSITSSGLEEITKKMNASALTALEVLQDILCDMSLPKTLQIKAALGVLNAMSSVNGALERGLKHRIGDFDPQERWNTNQTFTYDAAGSPIVINRSERSESVGPVML